MLSPSPLTTWDRVTLKVRVLSLRQAATLLALPDVDRLREHGIPVRIQLPPLSTRRRLVVIAGELRRFVESDPPGLRDHLARVRLFNRSLETVLATRRGERQPLLQRRIARVLRTVMPGWEHPERRVRSLFKMARHERCDGCYVPARGRTRFATAQLRALLRLV